MGTGTDCWGPCDDCWGTGVITDLPEDQPAYWSDLAEGTFDSPCETCGGTGKVELLPEVETR